MVVSILKATMVIVLHLVQKTNLIFEKIFEETLSKKLAKSIVAKMREFVFQAMTVKLSKIPKRELVHKEAMSVAFMKNQKEQPMEKYKLL